MSLFSRNFSVAVAVLGGALACGCAVEPDVAAPAAADDMPTLDEIIASGGKADHWDDIELCQYVCKVTRPHDGGCWNQHSCAQFCGEYATTLRGAALEAYVTCALDNPLCYESMESCMWARLYPAPFDQHVVFDGGGFGSEEGAKVVGALADVNNHWTKRSGVVSGGGFSLTWDIAHVSKSHQVLYYVDKDADGHCTPGVDLTGSEHVSIAGDWLDPYFHQSVIPEPLASYDPGWECDYLK